MVEPKLLIKASLDAGREFFRAPAHEASASAPGLGGGPAEAKREPVLIPIRSLGANHRERIAQHLLGLDEHDRYLRFGYAAND